MTVSEKNRGSQPKKPLGTFEPATPTKSSILMGSRRCALTQKTKQKKKRKRRKKTALSALHTEPFWSMLQ